MLGAIYGDIAGSPYEPGTSYWYNQSTPYDFTIFGAGSHITDDSLMTLAVANALVVSRSDMGDYRRNLIYSMLKIARDHPRVGWGENFKRWLFDSGDDPSPINSFGNGAAMRISPVGWVCDTLEETIALSKHTTEVSHNHPEGIKGAEAIAVAIFLARTGSTKEEIKEKMLGYYPEIENMTVAGLISSSYGDPESSGWITCQGSVPPGHLRLSGIRQSGVSRSKCDQAERRHRYAGRHGGFRRGGFLRLQLRRRGQSTGVPYARFAIDLSRFQNR